MLVVVQLGEETYKAAVVCYDNPRNEDSEHQIPVLRYRKYLHIGTRSVHLRHMSLFILSENPEVVEQGSCVGDRNKRNVLFCSNSGREYKIVAFLDDLNQNIQDACANPGALNVIPIYDADVITFKKVKCMSFEGEMNASYFVKEWLGAIIVNLYDTTSLYMEVVRGKRTFQRREQERETRPNTVPNSFIFWMWWPLSKPRILDTWLQEIRNKKIVQKGDFLRVFPGGSGFIRVALIPSSAGSEFETLRLLDNEGSEFSAFLVQGDAESVYNSETKVIINENFVLAATSERTGHGNSYGCYLETAYVTVHLLPYNENDHCPMYPDRSLYEELRKFVQDAKSDATDKYGNPVIKEAGKVLRKAQRLCAEFKRTLQILGREGHPYFQF